VRKQLLYTGHLPKGRTKHNVLLGGVKKSWNRKMKPTHGQLDMICLAQKEGREGDIKKNCEESRRYGGRRDENGGGCLQASRVSCAAKASASLNTNYERRS